MFSLTKLNNQKNVGEKRQGATVLCASVCEKETAIVKKKKHIYTQENLLLLAAPTHIHKHAYLVQLLRKLNKISFLE